MCCLYWTSNSYFTSPFYVVCVIFSGLCCGEHDPVEEPLGQAAVQSLRASVSDGTRGPK